MHITEVSPRERARAGGVVLRCFAPNGAVPNAALPVLIYRRAFAGLSADAILARLAENGWVGGWTWTVYDFHHYHPASHEVLAVSRGAGDIVLGGPGHKPMQVRAGDVLVLPAGVGHALAASTADFEVCGAYPPGQERPEIARPYHERLAQDRRDIAATPLPRTDPVMGTEGPLLRAWNVVETC